MACKMENIVEGYDERRFEGQVKPDLLCSICHNVLREPKTCENEEHPFCLACITRHLRNSSTCPECREYLTPQTLKRPARFFMNCLSELKISCDYKDLGCPEYVELGNLKSHVAQCEFAPEMRGDAECEMDSSHEFRILKCHDCRDIKASQGKITAGQDRMNVEITETKVQIARIERKLDEINEKVNVEEIKQIQTDTKASQDKIKAELDGTSVQIAAVERKQDQINERVDQIKVNVEEIKQIQTDTKVSQDKIKVELDGTNSQIAAVERKQDQINERVDQIKVNVGEIKQIQTDSKASQDKIKLELDGTNVQIAAVERKQDQINERVDQIKANVDEVKQIQADMKADQARFKDELRDQFQSMRGMMDRIMRRNNSNGVVAAGKTNPECKQQ